ncbi:hypothetical protein EV426DRAFT_568050 [Tirmania nivea]|nr:hypothetical protein EV426DRAFT_568050 [Tirmania nivea]
MTLPDTSEPSIMPSDLPPNLPTWTREDVQKYFKSKPRLPDQYIARLYDEHVCGIDFPDLTMQELVTSYKFPRAVAKSFDKVITAVLPQGAAVECRPFKIRRLEENDIVWSDPEHYQQVVYDSSVTKYDIDQSHRQGFQLTDTPDFVRVYARPMFHKQMEFLIDMLTDDTIEAWVVGPYGTGKSTTTEIFSSHITHTQDTIVTWISWRPATYPSLVRLENTTKKTCELTKTSSLPTILLEVEDKPHVVVLDGYIDSTAAEKTLAGCRAWLRRSTDLTRKLVVVSSMWGRSKAQRGPREKCRTFQVSSWLLEEYMEAIKDDNLFKSVEKYLDAGVTLPSNSSLSKTARREALITSKYYFGGGFCRGVFEMSSKELTEYFHQAIQSIDGYVGCHSRYVTNRLVGTMLDSKGDLQSISISPYVARELAVTVGPRLLEPFLRNFPDLEDPIIQGLFFEAKFFSLIRLTRGQEKFQILTKDGMISWESPGVSRFDPQKPSLPSTPSIWLMPEKWNQGGYDAIFIDRRQSLLRFIQVTIRHNHDFKCEYYNSVIDKIGLEFKKIEVYFVVPVDKLSVFKIPENGHLRTCPSDMKAHLRGVEGTNGDTGEVTGEGGCYCVAWRKVAALDWLL